MKFHLHVYHMLKSFVQIDRASPFATLRTWRALTLTQNATPFSRTLLCPCIINTLTLSVDLYTFMSFQVRSDRQSITICHAENLESFDLDTERHAFLKDAPMPMYNPCACVVDNFLYVCGGKYDSNENNEIATARCFRYDPRFDSW